MRHQRLPGRGGRRGGSRTLHARTSHVPLAEQPSARLSCQPRPLRRAGARVFGRQPRCTRAPDRCSPSTLPAAPSREAQLETDVVDSGMGTLMWANKRVRWALRSGETAGLQRQTARLSLANVLPREGARTCRASRARSSGGWVTRSPWRRRPAQSPVGLVVTRRGRGTRPSGDLAVP